MNRGRRAAAVCLLALAAAGCVRRRDAATPDELEREIRTLTAERDLLRTRIGDFMGRDPRLQGMPTNGVRVGVPTSLTRTLLERVVAGFLDQVTLRLTDLKVHKAGAIRKLVTLGEYDLDVRIDEVTARLTTGKPEVTFGGNRVTLVLPVRVASGRGDATIDFAWDGKNISGAVCGDMTLREKVSGAVAPEEYTLGGSLLLTAADNKILASPKFPVLRVTLKVEPSAESWAAVQRILDEREGLCGFVLDKVDIRGALEGLIGKGFRVRLPTEKIQPVAVPVGISPTMTVRGEPVTIDVKLGQLAITTDTIWLGADVGVAGAGAAARARDGAASTKTR